MKTWIAFLCLFLNLSASLDASAGRAVTRGVPRRAASSVGTRAVVPRTIAPDQARKIWQLDAQPPEA